MALKKHLLEDLKLFLPPNTFELVIGYLEQYKIKLSIKKDRQSVYGDYRPKSNKKPHRISVNGGLNPYHFLITLLHEIAHLIAFEQFGFKIKPHGIEWKKEFSAVLAPFIHKDIFPLEIKKALSNSYNQLKASSCSDPDLAIALRAYDRNKTGILIQELPMGSDFITSKGQVFTLLRKRRTCFEAKAAKNGEIYLFPALYEVEKR